jgi:hypothetical protein
VWQHANDVSFNFQQGKANSTSLLNMVSIRCDAASDFYVWWNHTIDRQNPIIMKKFTDIDTAGSVTDANKVYMTWYMASGLSLNTDIVNNAYNLKSATTATKYVNHDQTNLVMAVVSAGAIIELIPPVVSVSATSTPWRQRDLYSLRFRLTGSVPAYGCIVNSADGGRGLKVLADPTLTSVAWENCVFAIIGANSTVYPTGVRIAAYYNTSLFLMETSATTLSMRDVTGFSAAAYKKTVFYLTPPLSSTGAFVTFNTGLLSRSVGCSRCAAGTYSSGVGASACMNCSAGAFSLAGSDECTVCPAGFHTDVTGLTNCLPCPTGTYASAANTSTCTPCPAGTYSIAIASGTDECTPCAAGYFGTETGQSTCEACAAGSHVEETGATVCTECAVGKFSVGGNAECEDCEEGSYNTQEGLSTCTWCSEGTYQDEAGKTTCKNCPLGRYINSTGVIECLQCPNNTIADDPGQVSCTDCPIDVSYAYGPGNSACTACPTSSDDLYIRGQCLASIAANREPQRDEDTDAVRIWKIVPLTVACVLAAIVLIMLVYKCHGAGYSQLSVNG